MALPPQKFREIVFLLLFAAEFDRNELQETALMLMQELKVTKKSVLEALGLVMQILLRLEEIDGKIGASSQEYAFERISLAEKSALRLGFFELFHQASLPPKVAISEAIRLTRKFGTHEGAHFVNAVLDSVYTPSSANESAPAASFAEEEV